MAKKVVILYDFFSEPGGIERLMLFQAKTLKEKGYDVSFAFAYVDKKFQNERLADFKVMEYSKFLLKDETIQISLSLLSSRSIEKFKDFDLVICHSFPASYLAYRIKKKYKVPYILFVHHPPQFLYNADLDWAKNSFKRKVAYVGGKAFRMPFRKLDNLCMRNADSIFVVCKTVQRIAKETYGLTPKIISPPLGKKFKILKVDWKELSKFNIKKKFILGSGRIAKLKRFDYLITAASLIKDKDIQVVLAGQCEDNEKKSLKELARRLKVDVVFLGPVDLDDLIKLYNVAKMTVLTCPKEWFSYVHIEAMACGCPMIAWKDNFGHQENIVDGLNGYLASPYSVKDLAKKIESALGKKWNKKQISGISKKFDEDKIKKEFINYVELFSRS